MRTHFTIEDLLREIKQNKSNADRAKLVSEISTLTSTISRIFDDQQPLNPASLPSLYQIMGLNRDCTKQNIKDRYKALALLCHPDKHDQGEDRVVVEEVFKLIWAVHNILRNDQKRSRYNALSAPSFQAYYTAETAGSTQTSASATSTQPTRPETPTSSLSELYAILYEKIDVYLNDVATYNVTSHHVSSKQVVPNKDSANKQELLEQLFNSSSHSAIWLIKDMWDGFNELMKKTPEAFDQQIQSNLNLNSRPNAPKANLPALQKAATDVYRKLTSKNRTRETNQSALFLAAPASASASHASEAQPQPPISQM
jgi:curved DNA-binding protein CbpA